MRKIVLLTSFAAAMLLGLAACNDKKPRTPMPNVVTVGSESVTVDSIAPDSALVVVEDTTVTVGVVTTPEPPKEKHPAKKGKKHTPQGKAKSGHSHDKSKGSGK
jgi:hypothetical protein